MSRGTLQNYDEGSWKCSRPYLAMGPWHGEHGRYREGVYRHPNGTVEVYEQVGHDTLHLRMLHEGRDYWRSWRASWGDKTIARLAREFVEDVTEGRV